MNPSSPFAVVVNDDSTQLKLLSGLLRKSGLEPLAFTRAEDALMALTSCADVPSLIVTDLYMPGIDGWQFCRLLRSPEYAAFNQVPILVVSATFSGDQSSRIAADLRAEAFLPSPVDGGRFCEQVRAILNGEQVRHPLRILIVDDSAEFCKMLMDAFENHGYHAAMALTAKEATEAFAKTAYDVAVLDYHLPDQLGDALLVEFRAMRPDCVCLMVTGDTEPALALDWMKKGAAAYLQKPFRPDYIIELCARARRERALLRVQDLLELRTRELRQSEEQFREVLENSQDASYKRNLQTNTYNYLSPVFARISGYTPDEIKSLSLEAILELIHPNDLAETKRLIAESISGAHGKAYRIEYRFKHKDGHYCWFEDLFSVMRNPKGQPLALIGSVSDITDRKQAEEALRDSRELFSLFIRHSPIYAYIKDVTSTESRVIQASDNFKQMIGVAGLDIQGKTMSELFPSEFAARMTADDWAVVEKGDLLKLDEDYDGRNYTTIKYPIVQRGKTLLAGYTIDITERKQLEAEQKKLEFQNRQLQKSESLGRMAGAIAHHFNNQLQAVMMNLQMALNDLPSDLGSVANLTEAMQSAHKAAELSSLMLTYLGQTAAKREPLDVAETCQSHLPMLRLVMPQSVVLETDLPSKGPVIFANANQIRQILTSLLTNAWEAMGQARGFIRLTVKTVHATDIPAVNRFPIDCKFQDSDHACIEVADGGCGIAEQDIEKIFDPFFSTKFIGRGLGLSVVLGIVRAHNGCVTVESQPGNGSVFRIFLPVSAEAIPQKPVPLAQAPQTAGSGTVLVVDDDPILRKAVMLALKRSGFTVFEAQDGIQALEVFKQHQYEIGCVLCDLTMPRMNGWATLTALRKLAPDIPVILASGYGEDQVMAGDHSELPQAFLSKPYELPILRDAIVRVIRNPKALA